MCAQIVWIEDDIPVIDNVVLLLERKGHHIIRFTAPDEALRNVDQIRQSDLVILDMLMPPEGASPDYVKEWGRYPGARLLEKLVEAGLTIPVVVLSVVVHENVIPASTRHIVKDVIRKPIPPSELRERVEQVLEEKG